MSRLRSLWETWCSWRLGYRVNALLYVLGGVSLVILVLQLTSGGGETPTRVQVASQSPSTTRAVPRPTTTSGPTTTTTALPPAPVATVRPPVTSAPSPADGGSRSQPRRSDPSPDPVDPEPEQPEPTSPPEPPPTVPRTTVPPTTSPPTTDPPEDDEQQGAQQSLLSLPPVQLPL